ncbi:Asp-tRNA(Asn)/Glu-tRNA(Gln) amidotransferase subunit GatC [Helicobacter sp. 11S02596-1]|uniref:Asp-tRNA(Asn)/Glu-tRNA(Gln) amidotransferase subunit GatC n=1 Tax=Helicobacter sp. 11S02596-1 TaxID=1476194 RepID=UPI000BA6B324|nr:Asp-tRNA(Asn)/Glu-tRNA(Gln) amidotransferase subunit GatC [Helicobacter sp. 11S02596-1]PAF45121.1 asparaginyl/glutamyl-tRNA amidotransferase subunit C [Helicobacter sp. 11S02596-1]
MTIDETLLGKLEKLGMIAIAPDKKEAIKKDLNDILGFVENISELDLNDGDTQSTQAQTPLREDIKANDPTIAQNVLKNAPEARDGYFIVPKIIE